MSDQDIIDNYINQLTPHVLNLTSWCKEVEEDAHQFGQQMENQYNEPMEYNTSYKEIKEMAITRLIENIEKSTIDKANIHKVYVTQEFLDDYNGVYDPHYSTYNISDKYVKELMNLFPNSTIGL